MLDLESAPPKSESPTTVKTLNVIISTLAQRQSLPKTAKPPLPERKRQEFYAILLGGTLMAINAGYMNAVAILDTGFAVSHVTGTTASTGIAFAQGKYIEVLTKLLIVVCFIFGSFLSGLMISYTSFHLGRAYGRIFLLASVILVLAVVVECNVAHSTSFMYLLTIVCGLQNGMTTRYSGAVLRTTHVTGSATDIGIILGRYVRGHTSDMWKCGVLITLMFGYILGGACGALMHFEYGRMAILLNIVLYSTIGVTYILYVSLLLKIPLILAVMNDNCPSDNSASNMSFSESPTPRVTTSDEEVIRSSRDNSPGVEMDVREISDTRV